MNWREDHMKKIFLSLTFVLATVIGYTVISRCLEETRNFK